MNATERGATIRLTTLSRAFASVAVGVLQTVERAVAGDAQVRTARGNAWEAVCADRARAQQREEVRQRVAALMAQPAAPRPALAAPETD